MESRSKVRGSTLTAVLLNMSRIANAYMPIHTTPHLPVCQLSRGSFCLPAAPCKTASV
ncbi:hypothetical protein B0O80DRAFT_446524 [Mortierella sp. GBAus27b]|nr:hypothetical protein B0O80DRAFT_446524 [Mortierella sp. GBAus27b]